MTRRRPRAEKKIDSENGHVYYVWSAEEIEPEKLGSLIFCPKERFQVDTVLAKEAPNNSFNITSIKIGNREQLVGAVPAAPLGEVPIHLMFDVCEKDNKIEITVKNINSCKAKIGFEFQGQHLDSKKEKTT